MYRLKIVICQATASLVLVLVALPTQAPAAQAQGAPDTARECRSSMLPVRLDTSVPIVPDDGVQVPTGQRAEVFVRLCVPAGGSPTAVQLLVHGIAYGHRYWNIPNPDQGGDPDRYSWEAAAARAGYATLSMDRIGIGRSSHPPSRLVDIDSNALVVHQVVQALRGGRIAGPAGSRRFARVILVGHSYGSWTAWFESSRYRDVDAVILTGATHHGRIDALRTLITNLYPAALDSQFAGAGLDPGYLTSVPGKRYELFYAPSTDVDPRVVAEDEATKQTVTSAELENLSLIVRTRLDIRVPTFLLIGELDGLFCSQRPGDGGADCSSREALIASERPWLGERVPCLDAFITPIAGHDVNAFFSAQASFAAAHQWLESACLSGEKAPLPRVSLTGLRLSRERFRAARRGGAVAPLGRRLGRRVGTRVRYRLSDKARVTFRVQRAGRREGRVVGRRCVRRTERNAGRRICTRYRTLRGKFVRPGHDGVNRLRWSGRLGGRRLQRGRYRLVARARQASGAVSKQARARFQIVPG